MKKHFRYVFLSLAFVCGLCFTEAVQAQSKNCTAPLSGTYTIGADASSDYSSIDSAILCLSTNGVSGPITFNIEDGTYIGQYEIGSITGVSEINTITFQSLSRDYSKVSLKYAGAPNYPGNPSKLHVFRMNKASYIRFKNVSFHGENNGSCRSIVIDNHSHHIEVDSCYLYSGEIFNSDREIGSLLFIKTSKQVTIKNSWFNGGYCGIKTAAVKDTFNTGIRILNNRFTNIGGYGIHNNYFGDSLQIIGNSFRGDPATAASIAMMLFIGNGNLEIADNDIQLLSSTSTCGICIGNYRPSSGSEAMIHNNFVRISTGATATGISIYVSNYVKLYFNTVRITKGHPDSKGISGVSSGGLISKNNIIDVANMRAYYITGGTLISDYNCLNSTHTYPIYHYGYKTMADYLSSSSLDKHSVIAKPTYLSNDSPHLHDTALCNAGVPIEDLTLDIDGEQRDTAKPCIGADEYRIFDNDLQMEVINSPRDIAVDGLNPIGVTIRSMGAKELTYAQLNYRLDSNTVVSKVWNDTLSILERDSFIIMGNENLTPGLHSLKVWTSLPNHGADSNASNDTLESTFLVQKKPQVVIELDSLRGTTVVCNDSVMVPLKIKNTGTENLEFTMTPDEFISTKKYSVSGASTYHHFGGLRSVQNAIDLKVTLIGDYDESNEYVSISIDGQSYAVYQGGAFRDTTSVTYTLKGDSLANWLEDGKIVVRIKNSAGVSTGLSADIHQVQILQAASFLSPQSLKGIKHINAGDSLIVNCVFRGEDMTPAVHMSSIKIRSNDMADSVITVPCKLTVLGQQHSPDLGRDTTHCGTFALDAGDFDAYTWSTGENKQTIAIDTSGTYKVVVSNGIGCYSDDSITVNILPVPKIEIINLPERMCVRDTAVILDAKPDSGVFSGNGILGNAFDPTVTGTGVYYVKYERQEQNGCVIKDSSRIEVIDSLDLQITNDTSICPNTLLTLMASGGDAYVWSNGRSGSTTLLIPRQSAYYYVTASIGNCKKTDSVLVTVGESPNPYLGADTLLCEGDSISLDAGSGFVSYLWSNNEKTQRITVSTIGIDNVGKEFSVEVVDTLNCVGDDAIVIKVTDCTNLNNIDNELFLIKLYPNPSTGQFVLESNATVVKQVEMDIMDPHARLVKHKVLINQGGYFRESIDLSTEAKGIYFIKLSNSGAEKVFRVIVQ